MFSGSKLGVLVISSFLIILLDRQVRCYDDLEKNCQSGEKIGSFKRDSTDNENARLSFECQQMQPSSNAVKEPKCEQAKPFICNGQTTGCPEGTWLAGVTSYQLDTSGTPDLLVPTCCSSENVKIEDCLDRRLNSVNSKIDNTLNDDEIYQSFTCLPLVKSSRQGESNKRLSEILYKASICKYTVNVPRTEPQTPPNFDVESSRPAVAGGPGLDSRPGATGGNGGSNSGLPTRGPRL